MAWTDDKREDVDRIIDNGTMDGRGLQRDNMRHATETVWVGGKKGKDGHQARKSSYLVKWLHSELINNKI